MMVIELVEGDESRVRWNYGDGWHYADIDDLIRAYESVRHGRWIYKEHRTTKGDAVGYYICSECGHANWIKEDNYCSLCGAKMQE